MTDYEKKQIEVKEAGEALSEANEVWDKAYVTLTKACAACDKAEAEHQRLKFELD